MSNSETILREAWIANTVESLRRHGSWAGRIHIHKLLFVVKELGLADVPFDFELYHYGPYSFELDSAIEDMQLYGLLDRVFQHPGYGPKYALTQAGQSVARSPAFQQSPVVDRVAQFFGTKSSKDLELMATCLWVKRHGDARSLSEDEVIERVRIIKPKYTVEEIRFAYSQSTFAENSLSRS